MWPITLNADKPSPHGKRLKPICLYPKHSPSMTGCQQSVYCALFTLMVGNKMKGMSRLIFQFLFSTKQSVTALHSTHSLYNNVLLFSFSFRLSPQQSITFHHTGKKRHVLSASYGGHNYIINFLSPHLVPFLRFKLGKRANRSEFHLCVHNIHLNSEDNFLSLGQ